MSKPIIAIMYDFDKTLCTTDMQNYAFIPSLGMTPAEFWKEANTFGIEAGEVQFDLSKAIVRKDGIVEQLANGIATLMKTPGITFVQGKAQFVDQHTIEVEGTQ